MRPTFVSFFAAFPFGPMYFVPVKLELIVLKITSSISTAIIIAAVKIAVHPSS